MSEAKTYLPTSEAVETVSRRHITMASFNGHDDAEQTFKALESISAYLQDYGVDADNEYLQNDWYDYEEDYSNLPRYVVLAFMLELTIDSVIGLVRLLQPLLPTDEHIISSNVALRRQLHDAKSFIGDVTAAARKFSPRRGSAS